MLPLVTIQVYPSKEQKSDSLKIRRKHIYRSEPSDSNDRNTPVFTIKFSDILAAAEHMHKIQLLTDVYGKRKGEALVGRAHQRVKSANDAHRNGLGSSGEESD